MKVFVAGATGVIGRRLVPMLVEAGHDVVGMTRSVEKAGQLREAGADWVLNGCADIHLTSGERDLKLALAQTAPHHVRADV